MTQIISFLDQTPLVCPNSPVHRPLKLKLNEKENQILVSLQRMLGDKRKSGANASIEAKLRTENSCQSQQKRPNNLKNQVDSSHHSKTSMMEFLHKKAIKRSL